MDYAEWVTTMATQTAILPTDTDFQNILPSCINDAEGNCYRDLDLINLNVRDASASTLALTRDFNLPTSLGTFQIVTGINIITPDGSATLAERMRLNATGLSVTGTITATTSDASGLAVGRLGATTPAFQVDASTATSITGIKVKSAASGGGVALSTIGETNVALSVDAAGSGTITLGNTSTGTITSKRRFDVNLNTAAVNSVFTPTLTVVSADNVQLALQIQAYNNVSASGQGGIQYLKARGTAASPAAVQSGDSLGSNFAFGYATSGGSGFVAGGGCGFIMFATENYTSTAAGTRLAVYTTPTGTAALAQAAEFGQDKSLRIFGTVLRIDQAPATVGTGTKTISNGADSSTNFGHYLSLNMNGTTYYIPCGAVAPT